MATHERDRKIRRITRIVIYFLLIAFFLMVFIMVTRWNNRGDQSPVGSLQSSVASRQSPVAKASTFKEELNSTF